MNFSREQIEAASTPEELQAILSAAGPSASTKWTVSTLADVADFFVLAVSTIKGWSQEGMPGSNGAWNLAEITRWRIARLANSDLSTVRKEQEIELNSITIEQKRLDLQREKGELLDRGEVELWASSAIITFREICMSLPDTLATSCPHELRNFVREEADRVVRAALTTLQRNLEMAELDRQTTIGDVAGDEPQTTGSEAAQ